MATEEEAEGGEQTEEVTKIPHTKTSTAIILNARKTLSLLAVNHVSLCQPKTQKMSKSLKSSMGYQTKCKRLNHCFLKITKKVQPLTFRAKFLAR